MCTAHCDCVAGLGETCTHIATLLFAVDTTVKIRESKTVTQEPAYWLQPATHRQIRYREVGEIDFTSAMTKKKQLDEAIGSWSPVSSRVRQPKNIAAPSLTVSSMALAWLIQSLWCCHFCPHTVICSFQNRPKNHFRQYYVTCSRTIYTAIPHCPGKVFYNHVGCDTSTGGGSGDGDEDSGQFTTVAQVPSWQSNCVTFFL